MEPDLWNIREVNFCVPNLWKEAFHLRSVVATVNDFYSHPVRKRMEKLCTLPVIKYARKQLRQ